MSNYVQGTNLKDMQKNDLTEVIISMDDDLTDSQEWSNQRSEDDISGIPVGIATYCLDARSVLPCGSTESFLKHRSDWSNKPNLQISNIFTCKM